MAIYHGVSPDQQPKFPHSVKIGDWNYPVNERGQALETCPLCNDKLPPLGNTPGHVCGKPYLSEQEHLRREQIRKELGFLTE